MSGQLKEKHYSRIDERPNLFNQNQNVTRQQLKTNASEFHKPASFQPTSSAQSDLDQPQPTAPAEARAVAQLTELCWAGFSPVQVSIGTASLSFGRRRSEPIFALNR